jgi:hypothetical protein
MAVTKEENEPKLATIRLYENTIVGLVWDKAEDIDVWSHEITEIEASRLIPMCCGIFVIGVGSDTLRCGEFCMPEHQLRVSDEYAWPPPHAFASVAFGNSILLKDGWLRLNADQCWCLLENAH